MPSGETAQIDVLDPETLDRAFAAEGTRYVVHAAGIVSINGRVTERVHRVNVEGTANVVEACRRQQVDRLAYISSVHAIPEPTDGSTIVETEVFDPNLVHGEYARTKAEATALVMGATDLWRVVLHPSGMIGPNVYTDTHLTRLIRDAATGALTAVVPGGYDFVDVRDAAQGAIAALERGESGRNYILSGHYATVNDVVRQVAEQVHRRRSLQLLPTWFAKAAAPLAELYYRIRGTAPLYTSYSLHALGAPANFSHRRATEELGYQSRPLADTVADTVRWFQAQGQLRSPETQPRSSRFRRKDRVWR